MRYALCISVPAHVSPVETQAKRLFADFVTKCGTLMTFKSLTHEFLTGIYRINGQMQARLRSHRLRLEHLDLLFERELAIMRQRHFTRLKTQKRKTLAVNLSLIEEHHKRALISKYFDMCKLVYRIRSLVSQTWDGAASRKQKPIDAVKDLFQTDATLDIMISMVRKHLSDLFAGTDPNHQVITEKRRVRVPRKLNQAQLEHWQIERGYRQTTDALHAKNDAKVEEEKDSFFLTSTPDIKHRSALPAPAESSKQTEKEKVKLVEQTALETILVTLARYDLLSDPFFVDEALQDEKKSLLASKSNIHDDEQNNSAASVPSISPYVETPQEPGSRLLRAISLKTMKASRSKRR